MNERLNDKGRNEVNSFNDFDFNYKVFLVQEHTMQG